MIHTIVKTKDVRRAMGHTSELLTRPDNTEGMGVWFGPPGAGKTTTLAYVANLYDGIYLRALSCSTVTSILGDICTALGWVSSKPGQKRMLRKSDMVDFIVTKLTMGEDGSPPPPMRPIFIDEADYCLRDFVLMDILRDIYDITRCPVVFVGMEEFARKLREHARFARRTVLSTEFHGLDREDAQQVVEECGIVKLDDALFEHVFAETRSNIGRLVIAINFIEKFATRNGLTALSLKEWGDRPLYFDQPTFRKSRAAQAP